MRMPLPCSCLVSGWFFGGRVQPAPRAILTALYQFTGTIDTDASGVYQPCLYIRLQTVVETPAYLTAVKGVLSRTEQAEVVNTVARNPEVGVSLGGGIRKMRIARPGRGKSGGARVVFLFSGEGIPVFLLTVFAKNEKADLDPKERGLLTATAKQMAEDYRRGI